MTKGVLALVKGKMAGMWGWPFWWGSADFKV